jgi:hypothetical protein
MEIKAFCKKKLDIEMQGEYGEDVIQYQDTNDAFI